ncbi:MAG: LPS assembly lipoprotein LptE [Deltaproteobacteria bacterium]|nr:LPS assembly lipoprotein LptE [Deltaproteobacteria bacterium]
MRTAGVAAALALAAAWAGCGYSATAGASRLPPGAEHVFVPPFANRTADAEAGALVAASLREELARRGTAGGEGAPARIEGVVTRVSAAPVTTQGGTWRLVFEVQARLLVDGKESAAAAVRREVDYLGEVDAIATEGRRRLALRRAASEAARDIVERFETM